MHSIASDLVVIFMLTMIALGTFAIAQAINRLKASVSVFLMPKPDDDPADYWKRNQGDDETNN